MKTNYDVIPDEFSVDGYERAMRQLLPEVYGVWPDGKGGYYTEIYADYRDSISDDYTIIKNILSDDDPLYAFDEWLYNAYFDCAAQYESEVENALRNMLQDSMGEAFDEDTFQDAVCLLMCDGFFYVKYPEDHYLDEEIDVTIALDTGDGNYDFTCNTHYPAWGGDEGAFMKESSLLWLAKQQGYTPGQLRKAVEEGTEQKSGFLHSCHVEMVNVVSHMNSLVFLVKMPLRDLIRLQELINLQDRNGRHWDARENPYCGYIVIDKSAMCGLYDGWSGGGSVLEIELEKDVRLPVKYIWMAAPDCDNCGGWRYCIGSTYGMCGSAWNAEVKEIHAPKKL